MPETSNICPECGEESVPYDCRCMELEYNLSMAEADRRDAIVWLAIKAAIVALVLGLFWYGVSR